MYVRRCNSFLEVGGIPFPSYAFPTLSHKSPSASRFEEAWWYYPHQLKSSFYYVCNIN